MATIIVPLEEPRFRTRSENGAHVVEMRVRQRWTDLAGMLWLPLVALVFLDSDRDASRHQNTYWMWYFGACFTIIILNAIWASFGREVITVRDQTLTYQCQLFGLGRQKTFKVADIFYLSGDRYIPTLEPLGSVFLLFSFAKLGVIKFDYGARTYAMGITIDDVEGRMIVEWLRQFLPADVFV